MSVKNPGFKQNRQILMPECVQFVIECKEAKGGSIFASIDRDFSEGKFMGSEIFLTPFMGESIMYRTIMFSFLDLTKSMTKVLLNLGLNRFVIQSKKI